MILNLGLKSLSAAYFYVLNGVKKTPFFLLFLLPACGFQTYQAKPIHPDIITEQIEQKSISDEKFLTYLLAKGYLPGQLPIKNWDLNALIDCALFFNPTLQVAHAQWKTAQASELLASESALPIINANIARTNQANQDINPFAYQLSIDLPINTHNKREIQTDSATHLSQLAKLQIAQTAWNIRQEVTNTLYDVDWQEKQLLLLNKEIALRQEIATMLEKRKQLGMASSMDLSQANLQLQISQSVMTQLNHHQINLMSVLAHNIGLPIKVMHTMPLHITALNVTAEQATIDAQKTALLNRLDILMALERYAVAENKLKLEIAKQYPDITISPGYAYEFGDKVWSLGFSGLIQLLKKNKAAIVEAEQLREVEVAQFEALQAAIISEINLASARFIQAKAQLEQSSRALKQQQQILMSSTLQFQAGEIDRLSLTIVKLEVLNTEKEAALAEHQFNVAALALENCLQMPIFTSNKNVANRTIQ